MFAVIVTFMEFAMQKVGTEIREAFHWVEEDWPIFLYLDNAGGHGTKETVDRYVNDLWERHNIKCINQILHSPEINRLDVGVWMAFQVHRNKTSRKSNRERGSLVNMQGSTGRI